MIILELWLGEPLRAGRDGVWASSELWTELVQGMARSTGLRRFKTRREAEKALAEIIEDGGRAADFRVEQQPDGGFVIMILENDGQSVAGMLGA
jgi:hypothetical protein